MSKDKIEVGQYRRWVATRYISSWDTMAKIVGVKEDEYGKKFQVLSYDDFKISQSISEETLQKESTLVDASDVAKFLSSRSANVSAAIIKKEAEIRNLQIDKKRIEGEMIKVMLEGSTEKDFEDITDKED